jgi:hypothetical protein
MDSKLLIDVMSKGEIVMVAVYVRKSEIFSSRPLLGVERKVKGAWSHGRTMQGHIQQK